MASKKPERLCYEERQEKILQAAECLFSVKGYAGTTTKAIAQKARVNEALLFRHYPTKEKLYSGLLKARLETVRSQFVPELEKLRSSPLQEALFQMAQMIVAKNRKDPNLYRMMLFASLEGHAVGRKFFNEKLPLNEFLENFFQERIVKKEINPQDPAFLAKIYLGLVYNYILVTFIFKAPNYFKSREEDVLQNQVSLFINGIQTSKANVGNL